MSRILPLGLFLGLTLLLVYGLFNADSKSDLPSPLIGKPVPAFSLPELYTPESLITPEDLAGEPYLVNFWASWCVTCRAEHPVLEALAKSGRIRIVGINFRDESQDAKQWLAQRGDPYDINLADRSGRVSIDFGVYASPETFLIDAGGQIVFKHLGALTPEIIEQEIFPRIAAPQLTAVSGPRAAQGSAK